MRYKLLFMFFALNAALDFSKLDFTKPVSVQRILKNSPDAILNENCKSKLPSEFFPMGLYMDQNRKKAPKRIFPFEFRAGVWRNRFLRAWKIKWL